MLMRAMTVAGLAVATPTRLVLGATYVGQTGGRGRQRGRRRSGGRGLRVVALHGRRGSPGSGRGEAVESTVAFAPTAAGPASATLLIGSLEVPVEAQGLEVPACLSGAGCETSCVTGACTGGLCVGTLEGGDDACAEDACDETSGCGHLRRFGPSPSTPCLVAKCDAATGCGIEAVPDGTRCGPDDCLVTQVDVCIVGQCVTRSRADAGRCANRWVPTSIPARWGHARAYDGARQCVVLFGADFPVSHETWEWDGMVWRQVGAALARRRAGAPPLPTRRPSVVVLFGADLPASHEAWEWGGARWRTTRRANE